jgi:hypothetical protein
MLGVGLGGITAEGFLLRVKRMSPTARMATREIPLAETNHPGVTHRGDPEGL